MVFKFIIQAFDTQCRTLFVKLTNPMKKALPLLALSMLLASACVRHSQPIRLQGETQGTYYNIAYYSPTEQDMLPIVQSVLDQFDTTVNLWVENSLIRKVNRHEDNHINPIFYNLVVKSQEIEEYTQGAFNCKIGALVNLYGFGFKNRDDITDQQVDSLLNLISQGSCHADDTTLTVTLSPGIELDFNAIAQGFTVDQMAQEFHSHGIEDYLIDVGGEVIAHGRKADGSAWTVGIERPSPDKYSDREIETAIRLEDRAVVTSGNYRKYYEHNGIRYSHTIDPATGRPVNHSLLSVSVVSSNAWYADAMATAFMVMGLDKSLQFIHDHPDDPDIQAVFFIYDDHGTYKTHATPEFQKLIK